MITLCAWRVAAGGEVWRHPRVSGGEHDGDRSVAGGGQGPASLLHEHLSQLPESIGETRRQE